MLLPSDLCPPGKQAGLHPDKNSPFQTEQPHSSNAKSLEMKNAGNLLPTHPRKVQSPRDPLGEPWIVIIESTFKRAF